MPINLIKSLGNTWELTRENLRKDLDVIQTTINTLLGDKPHLTAYATKTQSLPSGMSTAINFQAHEELVDTFGFHTPGTSTFTIPVTGRYLVIFSGYASVAAATQYSVILTVNNPSIYAQGGGSVRYAAAAGQESSMELHTIAHYSRGDQLTLLIAQGGGATMTLSQPPPATFVSARLSIQML